MLACFGLVALTTSCERSGGGGGVSRGTGDTTVAPSAPASTAPAGGSGAVARLPADDGQWTMAAKDYANTRYSALDEITTANVGGLKLAWTFSTGNRNGHEAAPLVVDGTMYVVTPFPNQLYALDLTQPGAPAKWSYTPPQVQTAEGVACCDVVNRGAAYADGRIYFATLDNQVAAVDAASGKPVWRVRVGDVNRGETMTMAPIVVKGKVLVGNSGGEMGVRGWLTALDAATGQIAWRAYSTGPDEEVLIGPEFRPFYGMDSGPNLGVRSWPGDAWKTGGGTVWGWLSYDPELDLVYYGTGNPGPWNSAQRPGDNKWTAGVFARDPDTGAAHWFYQTAPGDHYDYDSINESILLDVPVDGAMRRVLVHLGRNGYIYVIDRATGQVLSATPYVNVNSSHGVDLKTGRLQYNQEKLPREGVVVRDICPAAPGSKDWQPSSFSQRTGLIYIPHQNLCMDWEAMETSYIAGTPYVGVNTMFKAGPGGHRGFLTAWDPVAKRAAWQITELFPVWSGTVVTAGDVVFYGTMDRWFKAVDARTGKLLWQFRTASGIIGQPVTYRGPDGRQYVAIMDGVGGWSGAIVPLLLSASDSLAGGGFVGAMADLPQYTNAGGTLYVFSLP
ncbi:MAG TPA: methanol/ethanol family PQQ-dependent dehydrogenase [Gemmatimonadaceae bacterium]|nr:methanol/ethanol family PQQ-dependent dehydrogenase [Gemmatimonadaceae bacterium]